MGRKLVPTIGREPMTLPIDRRAEERKERGRPIPGNILDTGTRLACHNCHSTDIARRGGKVNHLHFD